MITCEVRTIINPILHEEAQRRLYVAQEQISK